jgi:hypothetical protein
MKEYAKPRGRATVAQHDRNNVFVATLALGLQPRQGLARAWAKREARVGECENEHSHSQVSSHFGSWSPRGFLNLYKAILQVKTHCIKEFFISLERY